MPTPPPPPPPPPHELAATVPYLTTTELAAAIRSKLITSRQVLEILLARIHHYNAPLNAVVVFDLVRARARADAADLALANGVEWGVLHGVPCTVKENNDVAHLPNTSGDPQWKDRISPSNEAMIETLLSHGAIIFGKTNLPFHAMDLQSYNALYGTTSNPWDLSKTPGGSSGGSAVSVACGFSPFELGGDIGGSIRTPASFCGVYGHKPTMGVIPKTGPHMERVPKHISVRGPLARSATDLKLLMDCLVGVEGIEARGYTLALPRPTKKTLSEYRVAVWSDEASAPVDDELVAAAEHVATSFEQRGAYVNRHARPDYNFAANNAKVYFFLTAAANALTNDTPLRAVTLKEYRQALEEREEIRASWERFYADYDILIVPSHSTPAFTKDESNESNKAKRTLDMRRNGKVVQVPYYSALFWALLTNTGRLPSTTFPAGIGQDSGLPLGLNIVSKEFNDYVCIDVARLLAKECNYRFQSPPGYRKEDQGWESKL